VSPPVALAAGLAFGLLFRHPFPQPTARASKLLLQLSVVGLGFGMNLHEVVRAGRSGFLYTLLTIAFTMMLGIALGSVIQVNKTCSYLISTGNMRGQCHCSSRSHRGGHRRADGSLSRHGIRSEFGRTAHLPSNRSPAQAQPDAVRLVGGAGDPRHQFSSRSGHEVRRSRAPGRYDCQVWLEPCGSFRYRLRRQSDGKPRPASNGLGSSPFSAWRLCAILTFLRATLNTAS